VLLWEGYKLVGSPDGTVLFGVAILPRADDLSMPHLWTVLQRLGRPELTGGPAGLDRGGAGVPVHARHHRPRLPRRRVVGLAARRCAMQRFRLVERGLLPYVILSQTVPLVALAPLVAGWGGTIMPPWATVAVIASYLAFFPVAVGMLRGLQSPPASGVELMRSYASGWWRTLVKLRFPSSLPYLFPALRLAGAAAVVGAVVGEISTGTRGGIGRLIIEYSREATSDPAKVYTAMLGAALLGLVVAGLRQPVGGAA
jgi:NitT/TauT family transport system permease protein